MTVTPESMDAFWKSVNRVAARDDMIVISKAEYDSLKNDERKLLCLEAAGVDSWDGYSIAMEAFHKEDEDV